jgi:hypothetical protein
MNLFDRRPAPEPETVASGSLFGPERVEMSAEQRQWREEAERALWLAFRRQGTPAAFDKAGALNVLLFRCPTPATGGEALQHAADAIVKEMAENAARKGGAIV